MKTKITAQYLPILAKCVAVKDHRSYLAGFLVEPAPAEIGGVYLVATNGNHLVVIHDNEGSSDDKYIYNVPKRMLIDCKPRKKKELVLGKKFIEFDGTMATMVDSSGPVRSERCAPIDGKFPDWRRVAVPPKDPMLINEVGVNPNLLAKISASISAAGFSSKHYGIRILLNGKNGGILCIPSMLYDDNHDEINLLFLVMPMRLDDRSPAWIENLNKVFTKPVEITEV